jgi:Spy/CpxP family protein refolding chaperone
MSPQPSHRPARRQLTAALATLAALTASLLGLAATPALADNCPNAQLRAENNSTQLPECWSGPALMDALI